MIAKVLDILVGTSITVGKIRRTFVPEMADLIGQYVEVKRIKNTEWYGMTGEWHDNKFAFHKEWIERDARRDSSIPIDIPVGKHEVRTHGGILNDYAINEIDLAIGKFSVRDDNTGTRICWPTMVGLVALSSEWQVWNNGRPLDQRYRTHVMDKYGVQVPDAICNEIARVAKANMTVQKIESTEVIHDQAITGNFVVDGHEVIPFCGWLFIPGGHVCPKIEIAHAICQIVGKEHYTYSIVAVTGFDNVLCIHKTNERGPIATKTYKK